MDESDDNSPKFFVQGQTIKSDRCIWCGDHTALTKSHLFPKSIGGRFQREFSCQACNSFLGERFESQAKKNAFLTAAMAKLGLTSRREAYRHAKKVDVETGFEMHYTEDGYAKPVPRKLPEHQFVGTPEEMKRYEIARFKKSHPRWPTTPLEEFYDDPSRSRLKYAGLVFNKTMFEGGPSETRLDELTRDPHPGLVFKIAYEFLALNGLLDVPFIQGYTTRLIRVDRSTGQHRIVMDDTISARVFSNTSYDFSDVRQLESIPFQDCHYIMLGLSMTMVLYVKIVFFGQIVSFYVLGRCAPNDTDARLLGLLDRMFFFHLSQPGLVVRHYPALERKNGVIGEGMRVEDCLRRLGDEPSTF